VLPECDAAAAQLLLEDIRRRFAAVRFSHEGKDFSCNDFHWAGVFRPISRLQWRRTARRRDAALYTAKRGGRNQVRIGSARPAQGPA